MDSVFGDPKYFKPKSNRVVRCKTDSGVYYRKEGNKWVKYVRGPRSKRTHPWCGNVPEYAKGDESSVDIGGCCNINGKAWRLSQNKNFYRMRGPCVNPDRNCLSFQNSYDSSSAFSKFNSGQLEKDEPLKPLKDQLEHLKRRLKFFEGKKVKRGEISQRVEKIMEIKDKIESSQNKNSKTKNKN